MHRLTVLVYVLAVVHTLGAGTDSSIPLVRYTVLGSVLPVLFLFALRMQLGGPIPRIADKLRPMFAHLNGQLQSLAPPEQPAERFCRTATTARKKRRRD